MEDSFERNPQNSFGIKDLTPQEKKQFEKPSLYRKSVEWLRIFVNDKVKGSRLPNRFYQSQVNLYGGKIKTEGNQVVFDFSNLSDQADIKGDKMVRGFDDHIVRNPLKMLKVRPKELIKRLPLRVEPKRYRAQTPKDTYEHVIKRLGLEEYYGLHPKGLLVKRPEIVTEGTDLLDILRQDIIKNDDLNKVDRFEALRIAVLYIKAVHRKHGGIADLAAMDIIFQKREDGKVSEPILLLPNLLYSPKLKIPLREQKATDLIDLLFSVGAEEWRRSQGNEVNIAKAINTILNTYNEPDVIDCIKSYMKRGRLTMSAEGTTVKNPNSRNFAIFRPLLSMHIMQRMKGDMAVAAGIRRLIIERCEAYEHSARIS